MKLQGMFASAATPFDHTGAIYRTKVQHNFDKWCRTSLAGFVVGGLTGEGPLLEAQEKVDLLRLATPVVPAGRTMILDVSCEGVHALATHVEDNRPARGHNRRGQPQQIDLFLGLQ